MATCGYSRFVSGQWGSSRDYPDDLSCLTIENFQRKIKGHLNFLDIRDANLKTEAQLLLARAGMKCKLTKPIYSLVQYSQGWVVAK